MPKLRKPGRMLVVSEARPLDKADPAMASFLSFLAQDIAQAPQDIKLLDANLIQRIDRLTKDISSSPAEEFPKRPDEM